MAREISMGIGRLADLLPEPWANGLGVTQTLAVHASPGLRWRVSLACIDRHTSYSSFPGCIRWSMVLTGQGVDLAYEDERVLLEPGKMTRFDGALAWEARLVDQRVGVLNVMAFPATSSLTPEVRMEHVQEALVSEPARMRLVLADQGPCECFVKDACLHLESGSYLLERDARMPLRMKAGPLGAVYVAIV
ncbi:hypothetical protein BOSP111201_20320 [Bordetella sputigena]|uniref:HutD family protein n=1 Tax=Bordetella sputigena TaxID=1416810 RepID=UPI0039EE0486